MIKKLTDDQLARIATYRDLYWRRMTSTDPADRPTAETAARRLAESDGLHVRGVLWIGDPSARPRACDSEWDTLRDALCDTLADTIRPMLGDAFRIAIGDASRFAIRDATRNKLLDTLIGSLWDTLWHTPWVCRHACAVDVFDIPISAEQRWLLEIYDDLSSSCFAAWVSQGTIFLCDRPSSVVIKGGMMVDVIWRVPR